MDINTLRGIATLFVMIAFIGICLWAYSNKRKTGFDEAANLPFADEDTQGEKHE
jgi:cytochrome c oxidase cbb3-type subunit 4